MICTHVFSGLLLRKALELYPMPIKTAFVATDYTCSPGVANSELDVYFIPDAALAEDFIAAGVPGGKLVASGMPVLSQFYTRGDTTKNEMCNNHMVHLYRQLFLAQIQMYSHIQTR